MTAINYNIDEEAYFFSASWFSDRMFEMIWKDEDCSLNLENTKELSLANHLRKKLAECKQGNPLSPFVHFYRRLDKHNQHALINFYNNLKIKI